MSNSNSTPPPPPALPPWSGVTPIFLGEPSSTDSTTNKPCQSEPSGLTLYSEGGHTYLFMVSDNGILASVRLPTTFTGALTNWKINPTPDSTNKAYDYESVTLANGELMIGVEGDRKSGNSFSAPVVKRFDQLDTAQGSAGSFTNSTWTLSGIDFGSSQNSGMEGLTLVPYGAYPAGWTNNANPNYGGVFFVSVQADYGKIYVYDLPKGGDDGKGVSPLQLDADSSTLTVPTLSSAPAGSKPLISDMFYDATSGALYILYDGGQDAQGIALANDYLQKLTISTDSAATPDSVLTSVWDCQLPWLDAEGLAINGDDMFIAIDSKHAANDGVFVFPGVLAEIG